MSFKNGQKVRIKGTDLAGKYEKDFHDGTHLVTAQGGVGYILPPELIEAVIEPITVTFDPVELPVNVRTFYSTLRVNTDGVGPDEVAIDGPVFKAGIALRRAEARKLAYAILTITEGK